MSNKKYAIWILLQWFATIIFLWVPLSAFADTCTTQTTYDDSMRFHFNGTSELLGATRITVSGDCYVESITISVQTTGTPDGDLYLSIYDESGTTPGSVLETCSIVSPVPSGSFADVTATCDGTTLLQTATNYWIVASSDSSVDGTNYYRWRAKDTDIGGKMKRGPTSWTDWDNAGAGGVYTVAGTSTPPGGGGGGGTVVSGSTSTVDQIHETLISGFYLFWAAFIGMVWLLRKH